MLVSTSFLTAIMSLFSCITEIPGSQSVCRSFRPNKGSGRQIAHLQSIEQIQMEWTTTSRRSHASWLEKATADEPLNPMAPVKLKPKPRIKGPPTCEPDINVHSSVVPVCKILHFYKSNLLMNCRCLEALIWRLHLHIRRLFKIHAMAFD